MTHWTVVGQILYTLWSDLAQSDPGLGLDCGRRDTFRKERGGGVGASVVLNE